MKQFRLSPRLNQNEIPELLTFVLRYGDETETAETLKEGNFFTFLNIILLGFLLSFFRTAADPLINTCKPSWQSREKAQSRHRDGVPGFLSSRPSWPPPPPHKQGSVAPPLVPRGVHTRWGERGRGEPIGDRHSGSGTVL